MPRPKPKFRPGAPKPPGEAELFTDREELLTAFEEALWGIEPDSTRVLVFHGPAGIGKSSIRRELMRRLEAERYKDVAWGSYQFDAEVRNAPDVALAIISGSLGKTGKVKFLAFEISSAMYWRKKYPHLKFTQREMPYFKVGSVFANIADVFVPGMKLASVLLELIHPAFKKHIKMWWDTRGKEYLRGLEYEEPDDILGKLPSFFGVDLVESLESNNMKAVIFLDGYESVWQSETRVRFSDDAWVREMVASCPGVLFVVGSRRPLPWGELEGEEGEGWTQCIEDYTVTDFKDVYSRELLGKAGIEDEEVVSAIIKGSAGLPLYLDLCVDICYRMKASGREPSKEDFPPNYQEIFERFIRDVGLAEKTALEVVSSTRFFNRDIFEMLMEEFKTGYPAGAFEDFVRFSFISEGEEEGTYHIHDLLRRHLQDYMDQGVRKDVHNFLYEHYRQRAEVEDPKSIGEGNVRALGEALYHGLESGDVLGVTEWCNRTCEPYYRGAYYNELRVLYEVLAESCETALGEHSELAETLNILAEIYTLQVNYTDAESLFLRSLEIWEKALGTEHPNVAATLNNLAFLYREMGRYAAAEPLHLRSLEIKEKALGKEHPDVAKTLNNLASLYREMGRYEDAEPLYLKSLKIREKALGKEHQDVAGTLINLACLYMGIGRYEDAEPLLLRNLDILEKALGTEHPDVAVTLNNLAYLFKEIGRYDDAEPLYLKSLEILEKALGQDHPKVAVALKNLAYTYMRIGRHDDAESLYMRSLEIREKALGKEHPKVAITLNGLAVLYREMERYDDAEPLFLRSLEIREKALGGDHPHFADTIYEFGILLYKTDRQKEAIENMERALAIYTKALPSDHLKNINTLKGLSEVYANSGESEKASQYARRAEELERSRDDK